MKKNPQGKAMDLTDIAACLGIFAVLVFFFPYCRACDFIDGKPGLKKTLQISATVLLVILLCAVAWVFHKMGLAGDDTGAYHAFWNIFSD